MKPEPYDKVMDDKATDHYEEYMEAGVLPGNLENDRLLTCEEMTALYSERAMFPTDWCEAQLAKADRWLIEWLNKHNDFNEFGVVTGSGLLLTIKDWQALKKQIGGG